MSNRHHPDGYSPDRLLDELIKFLEVKTDAGLCRKLQIAKPVISDIRTRKRPIGACLLIRMHEVSGLSIKELRAFLGDRRARFRTGCKPYKTQISPIFSVSEKPPLLPNVLR